MFISGRKHTFIRKKIINDRKSFCISIIGPKLWNYYYNMINIKKNIITFKKDVKKMFKSVTNFYILFYLSLSYFIDYFYIYIIFLYLYYFILLFLSITILYAI